MSDRYVEFESECPTCEGKMANGNKYCSIECYNGKESKEKGKEES